LAVLENAIHLLLIVFENHILANTAIVKIVQHFQEN